MEEPGRGKYAPEGGGIGNSEPRVRSIRHKEGKFGRRAAVAYTFRHRKGDIVVQLAAHAASNRFVSCRGESAMRRMSKQ
jgi:hypothetical protein